MLLLFHTTILLAITLTVKAAHINVTNANDTQIDTVEEVPDANETAIQIEVLKEEKEYLYNKINKAIDEAIPVLEKSNDTESITGLEDLKTLKKQMKEIHEATDSDEDFNSTQAETRRKLSISIDRKGDEWYKKKDDFYEKLIKNRDEKYTSLPRVWNRQKIAKQIQTWLQKQAEEKKKLQEMMVRMKVDFERCPDEGSGKAKKLKQQKGRGKPNRYPCCRKCCKRSYIGCL